MFLIQNRNFEYLENDFNEKIYANNSEIEKPETFCRFQMAKEVLNKSTGRFWNNLDFFIQVC